MSNVLNRVGMTVGNTPGNASAFTLSAAIAAVSGQGPWQTAAGAGAQNATQYDYVAVEGTTLFECGIGTYTSSGTSLSRDTIYDSSAGTGVKATFTSACTVYLTPTAQTISALTNLSAAAKAIATAADVAAVGFWEPAKDTDLGAWLKKCAHTSWWLAGVRPHSRNLVVARNANVVGAVTIYGLDDPACPVVMTIDGGSAGGILGSTTGVPPATFNFSSISALNGVLKISQIGGGGAMVLDFVADQINLRAASGFYAFNGGSIANRNSVTGVTKISTNGVASSTVNDVAMAILPLTPLGKTRAGLPYPTTAFGTLGGASVIRSDGVSVSSSSNTAVISCCFDLVGPQEFPNLWTLTASALNVTNQYFAATFNVAAIASFAVAQLNVGTLKSVRAVAGGVAVAGSTGVALIKLDLATPANSLIARIDATANTGWMLGAQGAIKGCYAESSAAVTSLVGGTVSDRAPSANTLTVNGTVTRAVVATGADMAFYGGFSASNFLEGVAGAIDPASADMAVSCWVIAGSALAAQKTFVDRTGASGAYFRLDTDSSGKPRFTVHDGTNTATVTGATVIPAGATKLRGVVRRGSSRIELTVNGVVAASASIGSVGSLTNVGATLRIGCDYAAATPFNTASSGLALIKISLCAPGLDQFAAMYAAESPLFLAGEKCLLSGSANAQALASDADTDQLAVAQTTGGTDVLRGLSRIANQLSTSPLSGSNNHKFVAASAGDLLIGTAAGADAVVIATPVLRDGMKAARQHQHYDPAFGIFYGVSTSATPVNVAAFIVPEGKGYDVEISCTGLQYGGTMTERVSYEIEGHAKRDVGANAVATTTTRTISEVTSTQDASAAADATNQIVNVSFTGKASTTEQIVTRIRLADVGLQAAA